LEALLQLILTLEPDYTLRAAGLIGFGVLSSDNEESESEVLLEGAK
jgi:hypothetical protein